MLLVKHSLSYYLTTYTYPNIWWRVQLKMFYIMEFSLFLYYFSFRSKYSLKNSVLKYSQWSLLMVREQVSHSYTATGKIIWMWIENQHINWLFYSNQFGTWSLTLGEEHRLRVFENRVLRRIFGHKRDGVTGKQRKLHSEELNSLYSSPNIVRVIKSRRLRWAGRVARMEEGWGVHKVLVGKHEGKKPLGRPRRRWEDNIKMDLEEVGRGCGDWMGLAHDRDR